MRFTIFVVLYITNTFSSSLDENGSVKSSPEKFGERIIGGSPARAAEFPFSAAINVTTGIGRYFCGGALVNHNWILTASQCVDRAVHFTIHLGSNDLQGTEPNQVIVSAEEYVLHPQYNAATLENDIALIQLRLPVDYTNYIKPIRLPTSYLSTYAIVVSIGWGQTTDVESNSPSILNRVTLTALSNEECKLTFGSQITDDMVCVDGNYNQGTCIGDSGGPLIQYLPGNSDTHVGVSSFFSANGCESPDPSGFTRTLPYVQWIKNISGIE